HTERDAEVPPTVTSGGVERKPPARRIIVAAGARAVDVAPATLADTPGEVNAAPDEGAVPPGEPEAASPEAVEVPPHKPAPYAPPIVLELGAHFVGLVHNDGARG